MDEKYPIPASTYEIPKNEKLNEEIHTQKKFIPKTKTKTKKNIIQTKTKKINSYPKEIENIFIRQ